MATPESENRQKENHHISVTITREYNAELGKFVSYIHVFRKTNESQFQVAFEPDAKGTANALRAMAEAIEKEWVNGNT